MQQAKAILDAAMKLTPGERAHIVEELSATLRGVELERAWEDEIQRRLDELDGGQVEPVSGDEVLARLEQRFSVK